MSTIVLTELLHAAAKSARPIEKRNEVGPFVARLKVLAFAVPRKLIRDLVRMRSYKKVARRWKPEQGI